MPESAQARGSRYHGEMAMRYSDAAIDTIDVSTAPHARTGFSSNTYAVVSVRHQPVTNVTGGQHMGEHAQRHDPSKPNEN